MLPELLTPGSPSLLRQERPSTLLTLCTQIPSRASPQNERGACRGGRAHGSCIPRTHPQVVTAQFGPCRERRRGKAARSRCLMWERAPGTVSAQPN